MDFFKYEAAGNDFIVLDGRDRDLMNLCQTHAKSWCDRHFGIGADGILLITASDHADAFMHVINADGSTAAMCGNGIRCVACCLHESGMTAESLQIDTLGGLQVVQRLPEGLFSVRMARANLGSVCEIDQNGRLWKGRCVDVGNPHAVFEVQEDPSIAIHNAGEFLSHHPLFPDRCNIECIRRIAPNILDFAVYERGVGPTLACGTGCVAAATAFAHEHGLAGKSIEIHALGGKLFVQTAANPGDPVCLIGPARRVFCGSIQDDALCC